MALRDGGGRPSPPDSLPVRPPLGGTAAQRPPGKRDELFGQEWCVRATATLGRILGALEAAGVGQGPPPDGNCYRISADLALSWLYEIRGLLEGRNRKWHACSTCQGPGRF